MEFEKSQKLQKVIGQMDHAMKSVAKESVESEMCLQIELEKTFRMIYLLCV